MEQLQMFDMPPKDRTLENAKNRWLRRLQKKSDEMMQIETTPSGKCGYMAFCDCCNNSGEKLPCAKAMRRYMKENDLQIDFNDLSSVDDWV